MWCAEGTVTKRQRPGCLPTGTSKRECSVSKCALCASACCIAGPVHTRTWPALHCGHLCAVTQGLIGPLHRACRAAPLVLSVLCRIAWCCALHCTALCVPCSTIVVGRGQWAVELLQRTATPPGGCGQWNCCYALPHCLGAVGSGTPAVHCLTALGQWVVQLMQPLPHCLRKVGSATPAIHCLTARGATVAELLLKMASLPEGSGLWSSRSCCNALLLGLGTVSSATPAMHFLIASGQWAVELVQ